MDFFKKIVEAVYAHYRQRNGSFAAAFHARAVISLIFLIYFTVLFLFLQRIANIQALSNVDIMKNKATYIGILVVFYLLVHSLGGTNKELEENRDDANRGIKRVFFIWSIIGVILLFFIVPYVN